MTPNFIRQIRQRAAEGVPGRDFFLPLSGWLLTSLVSLEEDAPGTLLHAFKSSSGLWRNAVAVALANGALDHPETFLLRAYGDLDADTTRCRRAQFADAIRVMKPTQIVEAALNEMPPSLMGTLRKIGSEPLNTAEAYRRLIALLGSTTAEGRARRRVLEQTNGCRITDETLQVIECLDLAIMSPLTATHVSTAAEAHRLNARIRTIRLMCSTATDAALKRSADAMGSRFNSGQFARSWLTKADCLAPLGLPIDNDPDLTRVTPASAEPLGRRFRNCVSGYAAEMAGGASAFFVIESISVIVVLRITDAGWMLTGVHTLANGRISRETLFSVKEKLSGLGVLCVLPIRPLGDIGVVTGAFMRVDDLDFFEGMDAED